MNYSREFTAEDYRNGTPPRAFGSETEFTDNRNLGDKYFAHNEYGAPRPPSLAQFVDERYLIARNDTVLNVSSAILTTGGKLYVDQELMEYATPECRTPAELVIHERGGELIARHTLESLARHESKSPVRIYMRSGYANVRNNGKCLIAEDSIGYHENYSSLNEFCDLPLLNRPEWYARTVNAQCFADYLALRKIIDGVGMVDEKHFSITQRPRAVDFRSFKNCISHGEKRPFYQKSGRIEVRSGERGKSDWGSEFKLGLTSLVLRLIEHDAFPQQLRLADPNQAVIDLARDPHELVELQSGFFRKGADVLKEIVEAAVDACQNSPDWPAYEQKAAKDFYKFHTDLQLVSIKDHQVSALADRIDWAARFQYFIDRGATYETFTSSDLEQVRDDLMWDKIGDREVARRHFNKFGHTAIRAFVPGAPNTRAKTRVEIAQRLANNRELWLADWEKVASVDRHQYDLGGPLSFESTYSERKINQSTKN